MEIAAPHTIHTIQVEFRLETMFDGEFSVEILDGLLAFVDDWTLSHLDRTLLNAMELPFLNSIQEFSEIGQKQRSNVLIDNVTSVALDMCEPSYRNITLQYKSCIRVATFIQLLVKGNKKQGIHPSLNEIDYIVVGSIRQAVAENAYPSLFDAHLTWLGPDLAAARVVFRFFGVSGLMNPTEQLTVQKAIHSFILEAKQIEKGGGNVEFIEIRNQSTGYELQSDYNYTTDYRLLLSVDGGGYVSHFQPVLDVHTLLLGRTSPSKTVSSLEELVISSVSQNTTEFLNGLTKEDGNSIFEAYRVEVLPSIGTEHLYAIGYPAINLVQFAEYKDLNGFDANLVVTWMIAAFMAIILSGLNVILIRKGVCVLGSVGRQSDAAKKAQQEYIQDRQVSWDPTILTQESKQATSASDSGYGNEDGILESVQEEDSVVSFRSGVDPLDF